MPVADDNPIAAAARALIALDITRDLSMEDYRFTSDALATLYASGTLKSLSPALPLLLRLRGKPFSLERHFAMEPIFSLTPARQTVLKAGRQVSKSTSLAALLCALSATIPYFMSLYVCPRFDQTRRFSSNYMKPFIRESPIGALLVNAGVEQSVLQRSYTNGSTQHFSYAFLDCDRTRGLPSDMNIFDEVQDIEPDFIPIINETLSASIDYGLRFYSGTPKTLDNTLQRLWEDSSQAEWCIPCAACGHWSIPSADHDIMNMIQAHGLSCAKCGKLIDSEQGMWVHARPQLASEFLGIHAPQLIFPMHYAPDAKTGARDKWRELFLAKTQLNKATFLNEKCGESCDVRVNLLTRTDIRKACVLPWNNDLTEAIQKARGYRMINMGVDWGGGGEDEVSYTTVAVTGFMPDGTVDLIYGERLLNAMGHLDEISTIMSYYRSFRAMLLGHDYGGSGDVRETMILQSGFNLRCLFPALYVRTSTGNIVTYNAPTGRISRWYYSVDKARSLSLLCQLIKAGGVRFPRYDSWKGLSEDLMALVEDKHHAAGGADVYLITRKAGRSDDFVHALNYACLSYWHSQQRYPDLAKKLGIRLTKKQVSILHPQNPSFPM